MHSTSASVLISFALFSEQALAQSQIPPATPIAPGCWEWHYEPGQPIPENAKVVPGTCDTPDGRCYVMPSKGCFEITGTEKALFGERPQEPLLPAPPPPMPPITGFVPMGPPFLRPTNPKGDVPLPLPQNGVCAVGHGWDFETFLENRTLYDLTGAPFTVFQGHATFEGWIGAGSNAAPSPFLGNRDIRAVAAPVYGNAIPIHRIRPPGWRPEIDARIGGDYWRFSQDINAHADFWIGSMDRRYSWRQHPGEDRDTWGEKAKGTLTSPECLLQAPYLTFRLGGSPHGSQRVEVHVQGGHINDYYGIRFIGGPGDSAFGGSQGFGTQLVSPSAPQLFAPPVNQGGWTVLRSASPENKTDWMQVFVFDLSEYVGRNIRIRIVDDRRDQWWELPDGEIFEEPEHLQADDFRFVDAPPDSTQWFRHSDGLCGGRGSGAGCSPVGRVPSEPPLWGVTDVHAHPMANVGFGGHVAWGDAMDSLDQVYDCSKSLPAIPGPGGRAAIAPSNRLVSCYLHGSLVALATTPLIGACSALNAIPFVGAGAAYACTAVVVAATAVALTVPVLEGATMHGAAKVSSGAVKMGVLFSGLIDILPDLDLAFTEGLIPTTDSFGSATGSEADGWWKQGTPWHSSWGIGKTHNAYQVDMIRRAFDGGLRLGVWDVVNSRGFSLAADGTMRSDWAALVEGTAAAKRIVASLSDIAEIVYTPSDAERVIRSGRMAVILGTEVDELGRMRPAGLGWPRSASSEPDAMYKQVDDLWALGIRKVTPVHATNNPIGGAAIFNTIYNSNNYFVSGTPSDGPTTSADHPSVNIFMDGSFGAIFAGMFLGEFTLIHDPIQPSTQPWNPVGWFDYDVSPGRLDDRYIGDYSRITYRMGLDGSDELMSADGAWMPPNHVLGKKLIRPLLLKGLGLAFTGPTCNMYNTVMPEPVSSFSPAVEDHFHRADGHRNSLGLFRGSPGNDGYAFLRAAMKKGMLIDTDHLSQNARVDLYKLTESYALEANWPRGQCRRADGSCGTCDATATEICGAYPTVGVHSKVRGLEIDPKHTDPIKTAFRDPFRNKYGYNDEASRSEQEVRWVARNGGTFALFPTGSSIIPPNTHSCSKDSDCASYRGPGPPVCQAQVGGRRQCTQVNPVLERRDFALPSEVQNDCDSSSKTFAVKYLWLMNATRGRGITPATDFNGLIGPLKPRYGSSQPWNWPCGGSGRDFTDQAPAWGSHAYMKLAQVHEASGVWYEDYASRAPQPFSVDIRYKEVAARRASEEREDRAPRAHRQVDLVYFNDFGPDNKPSPEYQMGNRIGAQMYPMKRWQKIAGRSGWDYNIDGLVHIGLYPDLFQDMRNVGVQWEQLGPLFHSVAEYIETWEKAVALGTAHQ